MLIFILFHSGWAQCQSFFVFFCIDFCIKAELCNSLTYCVTVFFLGGGKRHILVFAKGTNCQRSGLALLQVISMARSVNPVPIGITWCGARAKEQIHGMGTT